MNAPVKTDTLPEWRLDDLYAGRDDPQIEADLGRARKAAEDLAAYKGQLVAARAEPQTLGRRLDETIGLYEIGTNALYGVGAYASLSASTARNDPAWSKFAADFRRSLAARSGAARFFLRPASAVYSVGILQVNGWGPPGLNAYSKGNLMGPVSLIYSGPGGGKLDHPVCKETLRICN